jgi:hypothetical protein
MQTAPTLFDRPAPALEAPVPYVKRSAASREAAEDYTPRKAGSDAFAVLAYLYDRARYGATDREIYNTLSRERPKLEGTYRRARVVLVEANRLPNGRGLAGALMECPNCMVPTRSDFAPHCGVCGERQRQKRRLCETTGAMQGVWAITPTGVEFYEKSNRG